MAAPSEETQAARRAYAQSLVDGGAAGVGEDAAARVAAESGALLLTLLDEAAETWANGVESGIAEGRKEASTRAMFEGSAFRVFDPRPLQKAFADLEEGYDDSWELEARIIAAARQTLIDAGALEP